MLAATIGSTLAAELNLAQASAEDLPPPLEFGPLEPLARLMQDTPLEKLLPRLVQELKAGKSISDLVAAGALANARTFGGEDYVGFHTMMALAPALHMSREMAGPMQALPALKVLYRNTARMQARGGESADVLRTTQPSEIPSSQNPGEYIRSMVRSRKTEPAEQALAFLANRSPEDAFNALLYSVQDNCEVHRVVMPYRAWELLGVVGKERAATMLRQSIHYCVRSETGQRSPAWDAPRTLLPKLLEEHKLLEKKPGSRKGDEAWIGQLSDSIFKSTPEQAAEIAASALAEGFCLRDVGEAVALGANQLALRDHGRRPFEEVEGKPVGSVHGDSIGVHACDSANAWRNMAMASNPRNAFACLILAAFQMAFDRVNRGGDFLAWEALPDARHLREVTAADPASLLKEAEEAILGNLQAKASAVIHQYGLLGHDPEPVFALMLRHAISEDGSLHGEKFYRTVREEFSAASPGFRWRHLVALARVTASEQGRPAPGVAEAKRLLS
jgi:hypothetical protein